MIKGGLPGQIIAFAMTDGGYELALVGQCNLLVDGNDTVLPGHNQTINLRIEALGGVIFPKVANPISNPVAGVRRMGAQVSIMSRVVNYRLQPKGITRAKLVKEIAKQLRNFIEVRTLRT